MLMSPDHTLYEVGNGRQRQTSEKVASAKICIALHMRRLNQPRFVLHVRRHQPRFVLHVRRLHQPRFVLHVRRLHQPRFVLHVRRLHQRVA